MPVVYDKNKPEPGECLSQICVRCAHNYKRKRTNLNLLDENGKVGWGIPCSFIWDDQIDPEKITSDGKKHGLSDEEILEAIYTINPIIFCQEVLRINPYEYQAELLLCTSKRIVQRMSRRLGKTVGMDLKIIHYAMFNPNKRVIVFAPFKQQVEKIFRDIEVLLKRGGDYCLSKVETVKNTDRLYKKNPLEMKFKNGTIISGQSVGIQSGEKSVSLRGDGVQGFDGDGGMVIGDEIDYVEDSSWPVLSPIINEGGYKVTYVASTTPTGKRGMFYNYCMGDLSVSYKEIHRTIYDYPVSALAEGSTLEDYVAVARASCLSDDTWEKEYLAGFGKELEAEFSYDDLLACQGPRIDYPRVPLKPDTKHADYTQCRYIEPQEGCIRMIGGDWNGPKIGTRFIVIEWDPRIYKYKIIGRYQIDVATYSQIAAISMLRALNRMFMPMHIYMDQGYGDTQIERLHEIATLNKERDPEWVPADANLINVHGILMTGVIDIFDKGLNRMVKKENKAFAIEVAKGLVEEHALLISEKEYSFKKSTPKMGVSVFSQLRENLIPSLLKFKREISPKTGKPFWPFDNDHDAISLALGLMAFIVHTSDQVRIPTGNAIILADGVNVARLAELQTPNSKKSAIKSSYNNIKSQFSNSLGSRLIDIEETEDTKEPNVENPEKLAYSSSFKVINPLRPRGSRINGFGVCGPSRTKF